MITFLGEAFEYTCILCSLQRGVSGRVIVCSNNAYSHSKFLTIMTTFCTTNKVCNVAAVPSLLERCTTAIPPACIVCHCSPIHNATNSLCPHTMRPSPSLNRSKSMPKTRFTRTANSQSGGQNNVRVKVRPAVTVEAGTTYKQSRQVRLTQVRPRRRKARPSRRKARSSVRKARPTR